MCMPSLICNLMGNNMKNINENNSAGLIIEGRNPVMEVLKSGRQIDKIFVKKGEITGSATKICAIAKDRKIPVGPGRGSAAGSVVSYCLNITNIDPIRVGLIFERFLNPERISMPDDILNAAKEKGENNFIIIADEISDPHNLGAIIRTANGAGADGVIISKHRSAGLTMTAAKASAGAIEYTPVAKVTNIASAIDKLKKNNIWVIGADMDGTNSIYEQDFSGNIAIVIGNEGKGISKIVKDKCDFLVKIPMHGQVSSLNASVAGALMIYEAVRYRQSK